MWRCAVRVVSDETRAILVKNSLLDTFNPVYESGSRLFLRGYLESRSLPKGILKLFPVMPGYMRVHPIHFKWPRVLYTRVFITREKMSAR